MRRTPWTALAGVTAVMLLAGCTPSRAGSTSAATPAPSSAAMTATATAGATAAATATGPVGSGPTTTAAGACPFLTVDQALSDVGERLDTVTVSTSAGAPVGCAFFPASGALASSEHLPPPSVPVIGITVSRFADTTAAHNAMVVSSQVDPAAYSDPAPGVVDEAISFTTTFYAADGDQDPAFTFRKGTTVVLVRLAQPKQSFSAKHVGTDVAATVS